MPAGINQEIKLVYCVEEFQQKYFQRLTMCKILKFQFGFLSYQQLICNMYTTRLKRISVSKAAHKMTIVKGNLG